MAYQNYETNYQVRSDERMAYQNYETNYPVRSDERMAYQNYETNYPVRSDDEFINNTILGVVFLAGSWPRKRRESNNAHLSTQLWVATSASTLALAVLALVTPAAFKLAAPNGTNIECDIQTISHATAIILLPLTLDFNTLEICVLACAVLIVNYLVADAVAFFYLPNIPDLPENLNCNPWSRNLPPDSGLNIEDITAGVAGH
ncbi:41659_t:CDS:2 [Gigaspora margarita]|uniref:41659_t:CDS:1 n=1 Tax=Gigaspora margarita TaxID=4874 RepID=A0ABN7UNW6_GIGMA|nr:41659_t:CDS:2 [Gigaspora margarita]